MLKQAALGVFTFILLFVIISPVYAQDLSSGTAIGVKINAKSIHDGDIISATKDGYKLTTSPYDPQIFGVVNQRPALYISDTTSPDDTPIVSLGQVEVRVSNMNGNIKRGDFITSSTIAGVGQKATENGFVIGTAEKDFSSNKTKAVGLIVITLHPHYAKVTNDVTRNLWNTFNLGFSAALDSPLGFVRYVISGVITILSFFFGFRFFARASNRGVEAIGRNPLAKQAILLSVLINTVVTVAIMFFGVAIAYLILVL